MKWLRLILAAYLLGSIPFPWILARMLKGVDIRQTSSGATGSTNAGRVIGFRWFVIAAALDTLKVFIPTRIAIKMWPAARWLHIFVAWAGIFGHTRPVYFRGGPGGKAVMPSFGAVLALTTAAAVLWRAILIAIGAAIAGIIGSQGRVSVGSLSGSAAGGVYIIKLARKRRIPRAYGFGIIAAVVYIGILHWPNFKRIARGKEPRTVKIGSWLSWLRARLAIS